MFDQRSNKILYYIFGAILFVLAFLIIPSFSEFIIALHNRYSVYPADVDTNMYSSVFALRILLSVGFALLIGFCFPLSKKFKFVIALLSVVLLIIITNFVPSFLPREWCTYELTMYRCPEEKVLFHFPPDGGFK